MLIQKYHPLVGGAERQLAALGPLLQARNVDIHVITRQFPGMKSFEIVDGIPVHRMPIVGPKAVRAAMYTWTALSTLKKLQPDVIHAHGFLSTASTAIKAKQKYATPVLVKSLRGGTLGDLYRLQHKPFGQRRLAMLKQWADRFINISQEIETELITAGVPQEQCVFIPNGVDLDRFTPLSSDEKSAVRAKLDLPSGLITIYAGRLDVEKRVDQLVTIWPQVLSRFPDALLLLLGTGTQDAKLRQLAGEGIRFEGRVDDVAPYLKSADLCVLPSVAEGLSNALLEAMAAGLPVVATAVGGTPDLISHQRTGWLIPPDDPTSLQEALLTLYENHAKRTELAQNGRNRVVEEYSLFKTADRLRCLYGQLVSMNSTGDTIRESV